MTDDRSNNQVFLMGRVSADPEERVLPSGDTVVSFRLIVPRTAAALRRSKQPIDTFECSVWGAVLRRSARRLTAGAEVEVSGELRRRFSRSSGGPVSWVTVDVDSCKKVATPAVTSTS
ncbi:single-stranded DNA-binding protein [Aeromicrobium sp.]|uniref:single-stranded DNA-binding protein n=1 Tax=Aeromicrobium sp. TaxID=1871063 RepID=UPI0019C185A6|nr:single-stranded DNA-binding protein [Aeromicrobium sp.]MBC7631256.1 single-stranded DNA-binding protein [Aeromicrobium sp.]